MGTKATVLNHLKQQTENYTQSTIEVLTANAISSALYVSRSLASQYLNELVKDGTVIKTSTRPVYFFHREALQSRFGLAEINEDFYSLEELQDFIARNGKPSSPFEGLIGYDRTLNDAVVHLLESLTYPPDGLPVLLLGPVGTGKRTMVRLVVREAIRTGALAEGTQYEEISGEGGVQQARFKQLCEGLRPGQRLILTITDAERLSPSLWEQLSAQFASPAGQRINVVFISTLPEGNPELKALTKLVPITIQVPAFKNRSYDEREETVIHYIREESRRLGREIAINSVTLRAMVKYDWPGNIPELKRVVKQLCAKGNAAGQSGDIVLESKGLPPELLRSMQVSTDDQITYVWVNCYHYNHDTSLLLESFDKLLECFDSDKPVESQVLDGVKVVESLMDYLLYQRQIVSSHLAGIEESLIHIINAVTQRNFLSIPPEFGRSVSKLLYYCDKYPNNLDRWSKANEEKVGRLNGLLLEQYVDEGATANSIINMVERNLGIRSIEIILTVILISLTKYRQQFGARKYIGLIVCHGHSTASSMADAANTLLQSYVYDAIDMQLNVNIDQIVTSIIDKLNRINDRADAILLVDMGSLELLGDLLSKYVNRRIGVVNNVSTRTALLVGSAILDGGDMEEILQGAQDSARLEYTIIERKANSKILFVSESGLGMARRMRDLFSSSLPEDIPVICEVCDFNQLANRGSEHEVFSSGQVLFISGTSNPHISGVPFVALEEIINSGSNHIIQEALGQHLPQEQMEQMILTLRTEFTLHNIVGHLTILNPQVLLSNVTQSVDRLQSHLGRRFQGRTLVGIYIHVCCLVERLVTKTPIQDNRDMAQFELEHRDFIRSVNQSFTNIVNHYGVEIPMNEISYLYDFIVADSQRSQETIQPQETEDIQL